MSKRGCTCGQTIRDQTDRLPYKGGAFHVPPPDEVVFQEDWDKGERFTSGCVWKVGRGRVFYFRPGHETFPIYKQAEPLRVVENAVRWMK